MESQGKINLPRTFEDADIDHLVILIGILQYLLSALVTLINLVADMLQRLMAHNDQIPLSP